MNNLLREGEYAEIIIGLLKPPYNIDSIIKIVFMSFCIRNEKNSSYRNRKTDFVDIFLNNINIKFLSHPDEIMSIFEVINKLKENGWIRTEDGRITILKKLDKFTSDNKFLQGCREKENNPIIEVNKLDDKSFMEEVLRHV